MLERKEIDVVADSDIQKWLVEAGHEPETPITADALRRYTEVVLDGRWQTEPKGDPRDYRKELWMGIAISVAGAANCNNAGSPASWADRVLEAFDRKFKNAL